MQEKDINLFLEDLSFNSSFTILEESKYSKKLLEVAEKQRIKLPAKDLAVFECIYAYTDRINKNGCNLPKEEVEKALDTLVGKAVDFDHFRKKIVGHWIDAKLVGNEIIAYGVFFKGSLPEDYKVIKELFDKGNLSISFEAWGEREYHDASHKTYDLKNIEMAGGALLIKEMPAFSGAGVLELAKNQVLEFAQVMHKPTEFFHAIEDDQNIELSDDFDEEEFDGFVQEKEDKLIISKKLTTEERKGIKNDLFAVVKTVKNRTTGKPRTIRMFPVHDENHVRNALARLPQATQTLQKLGINPDTVKNKILKRARELNMKDLIARHKGEIENAQMYGPYDIQSVLNSVRDIPCMTCNELGPYQLNNVDFTGNSAGIKCINCGAQMTADLVPTTKLNKKGKVYKMSNMSFKGTIDDLDKFINEFEGSDTALEIILEESIKNPLQLTYEERTDLTDEDFALIATVGQQNKRKIRIFPIHNLAHINDVNARLEKSHVEALITKLGIQKDNVLRKINRRITNCSMKTLLEKYKKGTVPEVLQEIAKASIGRELTKEELEKAQLSVVSLQTLKKSTAGGATDNHALNSLNADTQANDNKAFPSNAPSNPTSLQTAEVTEDEIKSLLVEATKPAIDDKDKEIARLSAEVASMAKDLKEFRQAKLDAEKSVRDAKIKSRKDELGDFAKEMSDDDVLDELKYELAKLKKENATLKAGGKITIASTAPDLTVGAAPTTVVTNDTAKKVNDIFTQMLNKDEVKE